MQECQSKTEVTTSLSSISSNRQRSLQDIISSPERRRPASLPYTGLKLNEIGEDVESSQAPNRRFPVGMQDATAGSLAVVKTEESDDISSENTVAGSDEPSGRDSLLERLREKERLFDAKVAALDETLMYAQQGCVQRDDLIARLSSEVARLRAQLQQAKRGSGKSDEQRAHPQESGTPSSKEARIRISELTKKLRERDHLVSMLQKQLKLFDTNLGACAEGNKRVGATTCGGVVGKRRSLGEVPLVVKKASSGSKTDVRHEQERMKYAATLRMLKDEVNLLEQKYRASVREREAIVEENQELRLKVDSMQQTMEARVADALKVAKRKLRNKNELEAEVMVARLSMARLLRLLSEVPEMHRYLRVEGIDGDFVFAGYARAGMENAAMTEDDQKKPGIDSGRRQRRPRGPQSVVGTGVGDGIYGGGAQKQSYNIYLNGQWCRRLHEIVEDENNFLHRAGLRAGELEETAQSRRVNGIPRVPSPSDVLQGRQHDKDFWIPHAVFIEAQKFKNRYFPSLNIECFYPFLITINGVWNERMSRRVATAAKKANEHRKRQKNAKEEEHQMKNLFSSGRPRFLSSSTLALWDGLQSLRQEVRRRVTGKNSLELFRRYDILATRMLQQLQDVQADHATLIEREHYRVSVGRDLSNLDLPSDDSEAWAIENRQLQQGTLDVDEEGVLHAVDISSDRGDCPTKEGVMDIDHTTSTRVLASCWEIQQLLNALRKQYQWKSHGEEQNGVLGEQQSVGETSSEYIPASVLHHFIDGVIGFVTEVEHEVLSACEALESHRDQQQNKAGSLQSNGDPW
ncbi:unnamed protein product [Trypanosoma congolense IL3000]|uniref:WGS project CAEQ00000000 data, annotated contig 548 n=1 Tax=Trypanosoma congolense (strain IL3000) TaxID=1068625 RepID=F9WGU0_TRYCI|nr:unnamed protein product [Trypanosoma congolense IL3000]